MDAFFAIPPGDVAELRRREEVIRELKEIEGRLRSLSKDPYPSQWLIDHAKQDGGVFNLLEDLREAIFHYQMVRRTRIDDQAFKLVNPAESDILGKLRYARDAEYRHGDRGNCLRGTRRTILDEIEFWTRDPRRPPVYWLNGLAGTGKSTIAQTIAERTFADGQLGASFFCSRDFEDRRNIRFIFPTIAVQLARRRAEFRSIFVPLVRSDPDIIHESLYGQMDKLLVQPLLKSAISTVIVIDALDECEDDEPTSAILSVLGRFVNQIPKVKFFVTGRPEPRIRHGFRLPLLAKATDVFELHEVEPDQIMSDMQLFYKHNCSEIKSRHHGLDDWPAEEQLNQLCERAAGLFIYAMATVRFINQNSKNPKKQLDRLIQSQESGFEGRTKLKANTTLDSLYMSILREAFSDDDPEDDLKLRSVLGAVILAANPLSPSAIAALLDFDPGDVFPLLSSVNSLLVLSKIDQPVRPFHKSFPDFIIDPDRCTNPRFRVHPPDQHTELLVGCLKLMNRRLERNMCGLPDGVTNAEVKDLKQRTERHVCRALEYACRSWHKHLKDTRPFQKLEITRVLHRFLEEKFLFWLEVLSVLGATREAVDALEATEKWLDVSRTLDLTRDYFRFVVAFFSVINTSAPHIYVSALPLSPRMSIVRELYKQYACPSAKIVQGLQDLWNPVYANRGFKRVAAWSPCNRFIAVASRPARATTSATIEILDAATLERLNIFNSPQALGDQRLGFSPDGRTLIQFDPEKFIRWDLQTGVPVSAVFSGRLVLARQSSFSFAYSTDGKTLAVSGASSQSLTTIDTYDLLSGTYTRSYHDPEARIVAPIWTHAECLRFVTVKPGSITMWEAPFLSVHTPAMIQSFPTPDEITDIEEAAQSKCGDFLFLPAFSQLAFKTQDTIFIWDAKDSRFLLKFVPIQNPWPHQGSSFSSDGRFFSHVDLYENIYVWKRSPTDYILHQVLPLHSTKPLLSPNGESIIAIARAALHLWHTRYHVHLPPREPKDEDGFDFLLEFSPNEVLAASVRFMGDTVTILDLQSGNPRLTIDTGMEVMCLGVTASTVAVAGGGKIINWNLPAENCANAMASVDDSVHTTVLACSNLAYSAERSISPDLTHIAVTERGNPYNLHIHSMSTGKRLVGTKVPDTLQWVILGGREVWCMDGKDYVRGWKIIQDGGSGIAGLEPLETTKCPPQVSPWQSRCGYEVTHDGWVLSPTQKRLLWLPQHWRELGEHTTWSGRILGLRHCELPEVVIIEFLE
ncbi:hypothetical protein BJ322DRAFT_784345 [Thelephora terrestris]|uniref:NACHT domain-containing protein n=1 Tax=Thelephora terrestris TaxID=56493 RepID=A0A9P6HJ37_9AGAM|nr:hypothetical protein BJ322DRAFT_784345 [Thelephora terrestris]